MMLCPPKTNLTLFNKDTSLQNKQVLFDINPNYKSGKSKKEVDDFINNVTIMRLQDDYVIDYSIHGPPPYKKVQEFKR